MKRRFRKAKVIMAIVLTAVLALSPVGVFAIDYYVPEDAEVMTSRFNVIDNAEATDDEFSMISEDGIWIINITGDTVIYFEDYAPMSDYEEDGMTVMVRDVLFGRTLREVLDGRNLVVTYTIAAGPRIHLFGSAISIKVLFEDIMPLPEVISPGSTGSTEVQPGGRTFVDVQEYDWFFTAVMWCYNNGIMYGVSATEFAPQSQMTRAMLVTILWRYAGSPDAGEVTFADAQRDTWYSTAVAWASENGIVYGYDETTFGVNDPITREQMYTILYRYKEFAGLTIPLEEEMRIRRFADEEKVSDWALDALRLMFDAGIMFRYSTLDNYARPQELAVRGEIAGAMYFFDMYAVQK